MNKVTQRKNIIHWMKEILLMNYLGQLFRKKADEQTTAFIY